MKIYYKKRREPPLLFFDWTNIRALLNYI